MDQQNPAFLFDTLFCLEQHLEEEDEEEQVTVLDYFPEEVDEFVEHSSFFSNSSSYKQQQQPILVQQDLFWDDEELTSLLSKEKLRKTHKPNSSLARARKEAVDWMLRVNAHYSFSALTVVLAVDYLDRFFFSFQFQSEKPWMTQLAAVACLSLAAKVEETHVPLLLDLQVCLIFVA